jgi:hypothetical protein
LSLRGLSGEYRTHTDNTSDAEAAGGICNPDAPAHQGGRTCYEPFSGSGSQIIAGERLGRRVFAMELAPEYVAVALQRYLDATGKRPVLAV